MSTRDRKAASVSITRSMGKALADVLNSKPIAPPPKAVSSAAPAELGGSTGASKSSSIRRLSLQPPSKSTSSAMPGLVAPTVSGRLSRSSVGPAADDRKLPVVAEISTDMKPPPAPAAAKTKGKLTRSPKVATLQPSALPKLRPKTAPTAASLVSTAPSKIPASPVRLGMRKRRPSEDSSNDPTTSSSSANEGNALSPKDATPKTLTDRPVSPMPKRVLQKAPQTIKTAVKGPSPKPSPKPSLKENDPKKDVPAKSDSRNGSPAKKIARHNNPSTSSLVAKISPRGALSQSTPVKGPAKGKPSQGPFKPSRQQSATPSTARSPPAAGNDSSMEVSLLLEGSVVSPSAPTPALPRLRPNFPRTPSSTAGLPGRNRLSYASPLNTRGSILSWEDMSRSFSGNVDELGTFLTDVDAPFTPTDRTMSVYSDAGLSSAWGSPRTSGIGLTPSLSISQIMFPTPPVQHLSAGDASFGSDGDANLTATPFRMSENGDVMMDIGMAEEDEDEDEDDANPFNGPRSPDEKQTAVLLLQMQLAALDGIREERDALRAELDEIRNAAQEREASMTLEYESLQGERDEMNATVQQHETTIAEAEVAKQMLKEVAQEERTARVVAEDAAKAETSRADEAQQLATDLRQLVKAEAARGAAAEWRAVVEALRAEVEHVRTEREVLNVLHACGAAAAHVEGTS